MKLYRYRPVTEMLFKELLYDEIYLASHIELNDPLDLDGQLNFFSSDRSEIGSLVHFLLKRAFVSADGRIGVMRKLLEPKTHDRLEEYIRVNFLKHASGVVIKTDLLDTLSRFLNESASIEEEFKTLESDDLFSDLGGFFSQFLNNSCVACFSEIRNSFLMWSHYASGHTGICLEFEVDADPEDNMTCHFLMTSRGSFEGKKLVYTEDIRKVNYLRQLSMLSFYDFLPVFDNAGDVDLMTLSKAIWHQYANSMEHVFLEKLAPWSEEKEWRIVEVSFQEMQPENRILTYDSSALTGVVFGAKSSDETQHRIMSILDGTRSNLVFYKCDVDGNRGVDVNRI